MEVKTSNSYAFMTEKPTSIYFKIALRGIAGEAPARMISVTPPTIVMLIDKSGSMAGDKIEAAREAAMRVIDSIPDGGDLVLYTFSTGVDRVGSFTNITDKERERAKSLVSTLTAEGATSMYAALRKAISEVMTLAKQDKPLRLFLLTDGQPTDVADVQAYVDVARELADLGCELVIFGIGADYNEYLLSEMVEKGKGIMEHIEDPSQIPSLMEKYSIKAAHVVAREAKLVLTHAKLDKVEVFNAKTSEEEAGISIDVGDVAEGEERVIYGRIVIQPRKVKGRYEIMKIKAMVEGRVVKEEPIYIEYTDDVEKVLQSSREEVANEALATLGLIKGDLRLVVHTMKGIRDEALKKTLRMWVSAKEAGDTKTMTAIKTKTMRGIVKEEE